MKLNRIVSSLVTRMIAIGLLLAIAGTVLGYFRLTGFLREDLTQVVTVQQVAFAEYMARDVDYKLEERRRFLQRLAATLPQELIGQPTRLRNWLKERQELQPLFSLGFMVCDLNGKVLLDYPVIAGRLGRSLADNPDFQAAREGRFVIGRPLMGPVVKQPILPMVAPLKDRKGRVIAVLIGNAELSAYGFLDQLQQGNIGKSGGVLLISPRDKLFVASTDPAMVLMPTPPTGVNLLHDRAMAGFRGSGITVNAKGVEEISAIASVPATGWFVVARLPTTEALASVARAQNFIVRQGLTNIVMISLLVGLLVTWLLRPLYRAADQAEKMTQGEIPLAPLSVIRADEVGHLTTAFNRLLAKLSNKQDELGHMAYHDMLTGLPNRKLLTDRMQQALARAQRNSTHVAVLFLDLNGFKLINDKLGHEAGDTALQEIARRLLAVVRQSDTLARFGGDEFVLLAADLDESAERGLATLAGKCIAAVEQPLQLQNGRHVLRVSIGIAVSDGLSTPDRLLVAADKAMYQAKQKGQGSYAMAPSLG
jgi:diguanylate cyclase